MLSAMMKDKKLFINKFLFIINNLPLEFSSSSSRKVIYFVIKGYYMDIPDKSRILPLLNKYLKIVMFFFIFMVWDMFILFFLRFWYLGLVYLCEIIMNISICSCLCLWVSSITYCVSFYNTICQYTSTTTRLYVSNICVDCRLIWSLYIQIN